MVTFISQGKNFREEKMITFTIQGKNFNEEVETWYANYVADSTNYRPKGLLGTEESWKLENVPSEGNLIVWQYFDAKSSVFYLNNLRFEDGKTYTIDMKNGRMEQELLPWIIAGIAVVAGILFLKRKR